MWMLKKYSTKDDLLIHYEIVQKTIECVKQDIFKFSKTHSYNCEIMLILE
jgi:hypothetical protein